MEFKEFIKPELLILVPVLYFIGKWLCDLTETRFSLLLGLIGVFLCGLYIVASCDFSGNQTWAMAIFAAITQGILVAGASVYMNGITRR